MFKLFGRTLDLARTLVYDLMFMILGLMTSISGPTLLDLQQTSGTDSYGISFIFTARSVGYLIGAITGGVVLDCMRSEDLALIFSSLFVALGAYAIPWCRSLPVILDVFAVTGFAMGFSNTGSNASTLRIWGKKGAPYLQGLHFAYGLGGFLGPLLAAPYLSVHSYDPSVSSLENKNQSAMESLPNASFPVTVGDTIPSVTYAYSIIGALASVVTGCFVFVYVFGFKKKAKMEAEDSKDGLKKQLRDPGSKNEAEDSEGSSTKQMLNSGSRKEAEDSECELAKQMLDSGSRKEAEVSEKGMEKQMRNPGFEFTAVVVVLACLQTGLVSGIEISFTQMLTSYVVKSDHGLTKVAGSYMTSLYWGCFTFMRLLSILLACKVSVKKLLVFDLVLASTAIIVLFSVGTRLVEGLWVGTAMLGIGIASIFPATLSWAEKYIYFNNRIASAFTIVSSILEMTVPLSISIYLDTHPNVLFNFMTFAIASVICIFIVMNYVVTRKGEKYEVPSEFEMSIKSVAV